jgi:quercetin dioxygenase-like cupin family protein
MLPRGTSINNELAKVPNMSVKHLRDLPMESLKVGEKTAKQVLISSEEAPNFALRRFMIEAGGFMPLHTNTVEHEQFCLGGKAEVVLGDETIIISKDDVVFIPAGMPHSYRTISEEAFEFLCLVPNQEDVIEILK